MTTTIMQFLWYGRSNRAVMLRAVKIIAMSLLVVLLLLPETCFALDASSIYDAKKFLSNKDVSLLLLSKIFGNIPGIQGFDKSGTTVIGALFYAFNWGLFGCSGLFLCYTTIKTIAETSLEGGQMKSNLAATWTVLRVICGVGLLIPNVSGYATVNTIVMWVILQSISLANWVWYTANQGFKGNVGITSSVLEAASKTRGNTDEIEAAKRAARQVDTAIKDLIKYDGNPATKVGVTDLLRSLVCAETVKIALDSIPKQQDINSSLTSKFQAYKCEKGVCTMPFLQVSDQLPVDAKLFGLLFPDYKITDAQKQQAITEPVNRFRVTDLQGMCGVFTVDTGKIDDHDRDAAAVNLQQLLSTLDVEAKRLMDIATSTDKDKLKTIDPFEYVVGTAKDGKPVKLATPGAANNPPQPSEYIKKHESYQQDIFEGKSDVQVEDVKQQLSRLKIPQTSQELLSATATYYQSNIPIKNDANSIRTAEEQVQDQNELSRGWAVAGSYYRTIGLKIDAQANTRQAGTITETRPPLPQGRMPYPAGSLFLFNDTPNLSNTAYLLQSIDESACASSIKKQDDSPSYNFAVRALKWIYFVADYAKILKTNLAATSVRNYQQSTSSSQIVPFNTSNYGAIIAMQVAATVLAAIPHPISAFAAIPLLTPLPHEYTMYHIGEIKRAWEAVMNIDNSKGGPQIALSGNIITAFDPISKLQLLGQVMVRDSLSFFDEMKALLVGLGVAYGISASVTSIMSLIAAPLTFWGSSTGFVLNAAQMNAMSSSFESIARSLVNADMTMGMAIFLPMTITGLVLMIYIPLIPYMLFLFGVISWLIAVVCLMFAAPIICFLMIWSPASQENPLLSREAEAFLMQLLAAFVRPALMVAGLVVGVVLSIVSIDLLNFGFNTVVLNSVKGKGVEKFFSDGNVQNLALLGSIIVYTFIMISVVNMCFATIHVLYTEVMRMVGIQVSQAGGEAEKYMEMVKQGSESFAQAAGSGYKDSAASAKDLKGGYFGKSGEEEKADKAKPKKVTGGAKAPNKPQKKTGAEQD